MPAPLHLWLIAGEESGDTRGAELMRELAARHPGIRFSGAGGPRMAALAEGYFDNWIERAGVLGLWDVLKRYPYFRAKFHAMRKRIADTEPDAVVFIDYPGFNLRMAAALRRRHPEQKLLYYISPQVWAWNRRRIPKMARMLDLMVCLFPFEQKLYEASGLEAVFAGHPLIEELHGETPAPRDPNLLGFFPGSREREVKRLFPVFLKAARLVGESRPDVRFEVAAATVTHARWMRTEAESAGVSMDIRHGGAHGLMRRAAAGIVCSGTATLEAACLGLPYCLVYRVAWLTFEVGRRLVTTRFLGIVNILAGRQIIREFIQHFCTPFAVADEALRLLNSARAREQLQAELARVIGQLGGPGAAGRASDAILAKIRGQSTNS